MSSITLSATILSAFALLLLSGCAAPASDAPPDSSTPQEARRADPSPTPEMGISNRERCVVASVSDGDSMRCTAQGRVRLLLLDAPEMSQAPFGTRSRDALQRLIQRNDTVWLEYDVQRKDQYGRTLAHVWTSARGGTHVNLAQAAGGWAVAVVFQPNVRYIEGMRRAVATARQRKLGLWADGDYTCEPIQHKRGNC